MAAAVAVQRAHAREEWPQGVTVRLRLGLHTGEPAVGDDGYTGLDVVRASRIAAGGVGGQVLLSETTRAIVARDLPEGVHLRSLGSRTLKDIEQPEPISALEIDDLPQATEAEPEPLSKLVPLPPSPVIPDWVRGATERLLPASNRLIEERVLARIEQAFEESSRVQQRSKDDKQRTDAKRPREAGRPRGAKGPRSARGRPPVLGPPSVADEIAKLQALRDGGALTKEQYERAVERALERGRPAPD
ncbi:MAG TPA: adenylate/guanylate cyclase domain-containing protein [Candidatus Limnocylindria bacterium]|nr:adenylate/guanylate cyclase domain-containing protein [Candidatus Limnocylindria bacterium]